MEVTAGAQAHEHDSDRTLVESIAAATRTAHLRLNKLIIARLPLVLPPYANDPSLYVSGLLHIAPIYTAFESLWHNILDSRPAETTTADAATGRDLHTSSLGDDVSANRCTPATGTRGPLVCKRMHSMLECMCLPGLMRTDRLKTDIQALTGWPDHIIEEQLRIVSGKGQLSKFLDHMQRSVEKQPHVLLSYSYIFFMALFAGGRFIRASLESVGNDFWGQVPGDIKPTMQPCTERPLGHVLEADGSHRSQVSSSMPLRFFHFPTPTDGEDLKRQFKTTLADVETRLSESERRDIVREAECIFENMTLLMHQLDDVCAEPQLHGPSATLFKAHSHAVEHAKDNIELCPAMFSKAMRLEKTKGHTIQHGPPTPHDGTIEDFMGNLRQAPKGPRIVRTTHWVLVMAVGVIIFGAYVTARRSSLLVW